MEPIIYYSDYRRYLKDFFRGKKKKSSIFSYRYFCNKAGIKSPSFFKEVIDGKRNLTPNMLTAIIKALELDGDDAVFFELLVNFNQSDSVNEKKELSVKMYDLARKVIEHPVAAKYYEFYKSWVNVAIQELAVIFDWKDDYELLGSSIIPPISAEEAKNVVEMLVEFGSLIKSDDLTYQPAHIITRPSEEVEKIGRKDLKHQFAELGKNAIDTFSREEMDITFMTMPVSPLRYKKAKQEIVEFYDRLKLFTRDENSNRIYQLNVQFFPLSKRTDETV